MKKQYHVNLSQQAQDDLEQIFYYIADENINNAGNFILQLEKRIYSFENFPDRQAGVVKGAVEVKVFGYGRADKVLGKIFEFMAGELGVMSPTQLQGAVMRIFESQTKSGKFVVKKTEIKSGVVGDQGTLGDEAVEFVEDPGGGWLVGQHFIADAVNPSGGPGNRFVDLYKTL